MSEDTTLEPWRPSARILPAPDPILAGLWRRRHVILSRWPGLPLPTRAPLYAMPRYSPHKRTSEGPVMAPRTNGPGPDVPAAAMLLLWDQWEYLRGACPECGGEMLGTLFGGLIFVGGVEGHCLGCGAAGVRLLPGFPFAEWCCTSLLADTPWRLPLKPVAFTLGGPAESLRAVLGELGETLRGVTELLPERWTDDGEEADDQW